MALIELLKCILEAVLLQKLNKIFFLNFMNVNLAVDGLNIFRCVNDWVRTNRWSDRQTDGQTDGQYTTQRTGNFGTHFAHIQRV